MTGQEILFQKSNIKVGKINVDEQPELASQFRIMSIPTLVVIKDGKIVNQSTGAKPKNAILQAVNALKRMGYTNVINIGGISSYTGKVER